MAPPALRKEIRIPASQHAVWEAWTTSAGAATFFAPQTHIQLRPGGAYEILFFPRRPPGERGAEGLRVLSFLPEEMLSFEWNAPPQYPEIRRQKTWVVVQLEPLSPCETRIRVTHLGWGAGGDWEQVYAYFEQAWDIVLERLRHRFAVGPIDWDLRSREPQT